MRRKLRFLLMGLCVHILLSGFLLGLFAVYRSSYDHTHREQIIPASLSVNGNTAVVTVLSQSVTVELPEDLSGEYLLCFALADEQVRLCALLLEQFMNMS